MANGECNGNTYYSLRSTTSRGGVEDERLLHSRLDSLVTPPILFGMNMGFSVTLSIAIVNRSNLEGIFLLGMKWIHGDGERTRTDAVTKRTRTRTTRPFIEKLRSHAYVMQHEGDNSTDLRRQGQCEPIILRGFVSTSFRIDKQWIRFQTQEHMRPTANSLPRHGHLRRRLLGVEIRHRPRIVSVDGCSSRRR